MRTNCRFLQALSAFFVSKWGGEIGFVFYVRTALSLLAARGRLLLLGFCLACILYAHDFWIEPSSYVVKPGEGVSIRFLVGEHFRGQVVPRDPNRIVAFDRYGPKTTEPVPGMAAFGPAGIVRLIEPGLHLIAYHSTSSFIKLEAEKFESYLREEGLEGVIAQREAHSERGAPGRELFARCVKSLVQVGSGEPRGGFDRVLNLPVELVPENSPYDLQAGDEISLRVLREGKALHGTLVVAYPNSDPSQPVRARTDHQGRVQLKLNFPGPWLIKAVHMERIEDGKADWRSWWASLTFELPE